MKRLFYSIEELSQSHSQLSYADISTIYDDSNVE